MRCGQVQPLEFCPDFGACGFGGKPSEAEINRFGIPELRRQLPVARGLPGLLRQRVDPFLVLLGNVLDPPQIGLRGVELEFSLVPPLEKAGDSGGVLQDS